MGRVNNGITRDSAHNDHAAQAYKKGGPIGPPFRTPLSVALWKPDQRAGDGVAFGIELKDLGALVGLVFLEFLYQFCVRHSCPPARLRNGMGNPVRDR